MSARKKNTASGMSKYPLLTSRKLHITAGLTPSSVFWFFQWCSFKNKIKILLVGDTGMAHKVHAF